MKYCTVAQAVDRLGISPLLFYRKLRELRDRLRGLIISQNEKLLLSPEAVDLIEQAVRGKKEKGKVVIRPENQSGQDSPVREKADQRRDKLYEELKREISYLRSELDQKGKLIEKLLERQTDARDQFDKIMMRLVQQNERLERGGSGGDIEYLKEELKRKSELISKLIDQHAEERHRTDTITMKLIQDLREVRLLLENRSKPEPEASVPSGGKFAEPVPDKETTVLSEKMSGYPAGPEEKKAPEEKDTGSGPDSRNEFYISRLPSLSKN